MPKKGNGYDAATVVADAMRKCNCPEEKFLACACRFDGHKDGSIQPTHPVAVAFANWVSIKDRATIGGKMSCSCPGDR